MTPSFLDRFCPPQIHLKYLMLRVMEPTLKQFRRARSALPSLQGS